MDRLDKEIQILKTSLCFSENRLSCSRISWTDNVSVFNGFKNLHWKRPQSLATLNRKTCTVVGNCPDSHSMGDLQYIMQHVWKTLIWN